MDVNPTLEALGQAARDHLEAQRPAEALEQALRLRQAAQIQGHTTAFGVGGLYVGLALEGCWELGSAELALQQALAVEQAAPGLRARAAVALARVRGRRGRTDAAAEAAARAMQEGAEPDADLAAAWVHQAFGDGGPPTSALAQAALVALLTEPAVAETASAILAVAMPEAPEVEGALGVLDAAVVRLTGIGRADLAAVQQVAAARLLSRHGAYEQALERLESGRSQILPPAPAALLRLARARLLRSLDRVSEALIEARQAAPVLERHGLDVDAAGAWLLVARALRWSDHVSEARDMLQHAVQPARHVPSLGALVRLELARCARAEGEARAALELLSASPVSAPSPIRALFAAERAEAALDLQDLQQAADVLAEAPEPSHGVARVQLCLARVRLGQARGEDASTLVNRLHAVRDQADEPRSRERLAVLIASLTDSSA